MHSQFHRSMFGLSRPLLLLAACLLLPWVDGPDALLPGLLPCSAAGAGMAEDHGQLPRQQHLGKSILAAHIQRPLQAVTGAHQLQHCINTHQPTTSHPQGHTTWAAAMKDEVPKLRVAGVWWSSKHQRALTKQGTAGTATAAGTKWWSWRGANASEVPSLPLTITTQLSLDRADQLLAQCRAWPGPISAVLYVALQPGAGGIGGSGIGASSKSASGATGGSMKARPGHGSRALAASAAAKGAQGGTSYRSQLRAAMALARQLAVTAEAQLPCALDLMLVYEVLAEDRASLLYPVNQLRNYARIQVRYFNPCF